MLNCGFYWEAVYMWNATSGYHLTEDDGEASISWGVEEMGLVDRRHKDQVDTAQYSQTHATES